MAILYHFLTYLTKWLFPVVTPFSKKLKLFYQGHRQIMTSLEQDISKTDDVIWMHCASLGEFEQGRPVLEALRQIYPQYKIVLTFFSPSGYTIRKDYQYADVVTYLPWDTTGDVNRFLNACHPKIALFVKYELWPNLLNTLAKRDIPAILFSAIFRANQPYFKHSKWLKKPLLAFDAIFVQDQSSFDLLKQHGFSNVTIGGDTRFDRVAAIIQQTVDLPLIKQFSQQSKVLVAGSTWDKDEALLIHYINKYSYPQDKFIIAPHLIDEPHLKRIETGIDKPMIRHSKIDANNINTIQVILVDSIGLLSQLYRFGQVAYVGGGFGVGIHNILEATTYGIPVVIGPNYKKFKEAQDLIALGSCLSIHNVTEGIQVLSKLMNDDAYTQQLGQKAKDYMLSNTGATQQIVDFVKNVI